MCWETPATSETAKGQLEEDQKAVQAQEWGGRTNGQELIETDQEKVCWEDGGGETLKRERRAQLKGWKKRTAGGNREDPLQHAGNSIDSNKDAGDLWEVDLLVEVSSRPNPDR